MKNFTFTTGERLNAARKRKIIYICGILVCGVLFGTLLFWLINGRTFSRGGEVTVPTVAPTIHPISCSNVPENEKFNCHPDRPVTEKECLNRGCCYKAASDLTVDDFDLINSSYIGVPSCYFPSGYRGYSFRLVKNDTSIKGELTRENASSGFTGDVKNVSLDIEYINDNTLRIKLTDPSSKRYVPNIPLYNTKPAPPVKPLYTVDLDSDGLLTVTRRSSSAVIFKTGLSQLIYSDQFLQLSTFVASKNFYGFGEHKDKLLRSFNWTRITQFNQGDLPVPHRNLYGTHPFYMIVEPDGSASGVFLRNTNAMDAILQPAPAVTLRTIGGILDFFIMLGPKPDEVISQYTGIIGHPFMIPYWSLGFQLCRYGYFTLEKTNETLQRNILNGVPVDVQWHDIDYMDHHLDFTYDHTNFSGLDKWVDQLHAQGMNYVAMISPGVSNTEKNGTYPAYDVGKELDLFVKDINGSYIESKVWNDNFTVYPDFTNPLTEKYWTDRFEEFHSILDFDGVWLDMNEPLNFDNGTVNGCPKSPLEDPAYLPGRPYPLRTLTICMTAKHNFTDHYNEHNLLAYRESQATYHAMKAVRKNRRPFLLSRATFAGQGVYASHWSGDITSDWEDLRYTIPFMMAFNMYGIPMIGSDICGFRLNTTEELCARWQSLGAFYPFSRNHNDYDTVEQDPAALGGDVLEATKKALRTRYYLLPYFYHLFYRSHEFGETVIRPLFFEFPADSKTLNIDEAFLWGPALYVIPALYPNVKDVKAYFPKGVWYDFYDGKLITDKAEEKTLPCNITHINLAVRGGYILPLQLPAQTVADSRPNKFDILVVLDENQEASGEMYWDDGDSLDHERGAYDLKKFAASKNSFNSTVDKHDYRSTLDLNVIRVFGVNQKPNKVTIDGQPATKFAYSGTTLTITATGNSLKNNLSVTWN